MPEIGQGAWVVTAPLEYRAPKLAYFQPFLTKEVEEQGEGFKGPPRTEYMLERWSGILQLLQSGSSTILTTDVVGRVKGELPLYKWTRLKRAEISVPIMSFLPEELSETKAWLRYWFEEEMRKNLHKK